MKTFHELCRGVALIALINFFLFVIIALTIGGDAVNGSIENGHYYLNGHGKLIEVNYFIFMYSKIHTYSLFVTFPLALLASFLYWITGGEMYRPKSQAVTNSPTTNIVATIKSLLWKIADLFAGVFWVILDSWRKPDYELFVRQSQQECIEKLHFATDDVPTLYNLEKPLWGYFSGTHFYIQKWSYNPLLRDGGASIRPILSGKFSSTPQGTYIRLWHRFTTFLVLFLTIWFGTVLSMLTLHFISTTIYSSQPQVDLDSALARLALIIAPIFYISTFFISILIGSFVGKVNNFDIIEFVKEVLDHHHTSSQLMGFRLLRKLQGKD
ncbi:MAG: hypothetical protein HYZ21_05685 [Chloroflexi bacterium]|nr:hypothetical protein [Chloroflexota bacterium]